MSILAISVWQIQAAAELSYINYYRGKIIYDRMNDTALDGLLSIVTTRMA